MALHTVKFLPFGKTVSVESGTTLLEAAGRADIVLNSVCGGHGICGRCRMIILSGEVGGDATSLLASDEVEQGLVLSCMAVVESDLEVRIPDEIGADQRLVLDEEAQRFRAVQPGLSRKNYVRDAIVTRVFVELDAPSLDNNLGDCQRLARAVEKSIEADSVAIPLGIALTLPEVLRASDFAVTATVAYDSGQYQVIDVEGGDSSRDNRIIAIDVGTSTVVAHLLDTAIMETVDAQACFNSQSVHGREVTARIIASEKKGVDALQSLIVDDINRLVKILTERNGLDGSRIRCMVCSGNTVMNHFLLGLPCNNIRRTPYVPVDLEPAAVPAADLGIEINPNGRVYSVPSISGWVGGDLTAGILAVGLHESEKPSMLIDVGTNGEIVVGNRDWLIASSASTGPALEGASVECGMMAESGAIEQVWSEDGALRFKTIGDAEPEGLCGSGIIDLLAELLELGIIDRGGVIVADSHESVSREGDIARIAISEKVFITQDDIENIVTAKAAVFAAAKILMDRVDMKFSELDKLYIAGGFGAYIDREKAVRIGLLPDLPRANIQYVGNTSIWGATLSALSSEAYEALREIRRKTTYYDLMGAQDYVEQFQQARFLPHTDLQLFPSVTEKADGGME